MNKKSAHARISCSLQKHAAKNFKDEKKSLPHNIFPQYFLSVISLTWTSFETQWLKCQSPLRLCWLIQSCCGKLKKWTKESAHARACADHVLSSIKRWEKVQRRKKSLPHHIFLQYFLRLSYVTWTSFGTQN